MNKDVNIKAPISVEFNITSKCQNKCVFCFSEIGQPTGASSFKDMSDRKILKCLDRIADAGIYNIFLTGGEPTLRKITEVISYCIDLGLHCQISTNAHVIDKKTAKKIADTGLGTIQVSLEATKTLNNKLVRNEKGFEKTMRGLKNLLQTDLSVVVCAVCLKQNYAALPNLLKEIDKIGVRGFRTIPLIPQSNEMLQMLPSLDLLTSANLKILEEASNYENIRIISLYNGHNSLYYERDLKKIPSPVDGIIHPLVTQCYAAKTQLMILSDGTVVLCSMFNDPKHHLGKLPEDDIVEIWQSEKASFYRSITPDKYTGRCGKCQYKNWCYSCRAVAERFDGDIFGDDLSCPHNRGDILSKENANRLKSFLKENENVIMYGRLH